jgi:hypothetical protein
LKPVVYIHIIQKKIPEEAFSISDAVLSGSANETNGTDKYQDAERGSSSGTESNGFSAPLQAKNQPQAGPSFEGIALPYFGSTTKAEEENSCSADKNPVGLIQETRQERTMKMMTVFYVKSITMTRMGRR